MALREQPYLPLYVQDFLTDEKLIECSASSTGVYIRLMCIMHKSENYGCILLKQKDKQTDNIIKNFALKIAKQMPYDLNTIEQALIELLEESVINIEDDVLYQKRMKNDGILSDKRSKAGRRGGQTTQNKNHDDNFDLDFAKAKQQANTENEIVVVIDNKNIEEKDNRGVGEEEKTEPPNVYDFIEQNFGRTLTPVEIQKIADWNNEFSEEQEAIKIIKYAIEIAISQNVKTFAYVEGILNNWKASGYSNFEQIKQNQNNYQGKTKASSIWQNQDVEINPMSPEELEELERILNSDRNENDKL